MKSRIDGDRHGLPGCIVEPTQTREVFSVRKKALMRKNGRPIGIIRTLIVTVRR
jgi:hypothetical protein